MNYVSILGDSISTFEGQNPHGFLVYYTNTMQAENGLLSVENTWWAKVLRALNAQLCVNNSYSGSMVSGSCFPAGISDRRLMYLHTDEKPNLILIYMGLNDYAHGVSSLHNDETDFQDPVYCFEDAYDIMLGKIRKYYPDATVICSTLIRPFVIGYENLNFPEVYKGAVFEDYNAAIRKSAHKHDCQLADLSSYNEKYETIDGVHPTVNGQLTFADLWIKCLIDLGLC